MHLPEGTRPPKFLISTDGCSDEDAVKMGDCSDVPGVTSYAAFQKALRAMG